MPIKSDTYAQHEVSQFLSIDVEITKFSALCDKAWWIAIPDDLTQLSVEKLLLNLG